MIGGEPRIGSVIRYSYLWDRQRRAGQVEGEKDRPCALVAAVKRVDGRILVRVLPITTRQPERDQRAVELTDLARQRLGLDAPTSWILVDESNEFVWPGPDVRPLPGKEPATIHHGFLASGTIRRVIASMLVSIRAKSHIAVRRDET